MRALIVPLPPGHPVKSGNKIKSRTILHCTLVINTELIKITQKYINKLFKMVFISKALLCHVMKIQGRCKCRLSFYETKDEENQHVPNYHSKTKSKTKHGISLDKDTNKTRNLNDMTNGVQQVAGVSDHGHMMVQWLMGHEAVGSKYELVSPLAGSEAKNIY